MTEEVIYCKHCGEQFAEKWSLMNYRKEKHPDAVAVCQNYLENKCKFSSKECWWNHDSRRTKSEMCCFNCQRTFKTKSEMMQHRKQEHKSIVKMCSNFQQNSCRWSTSYCWFLHEEEKMDMEYSLNEKANEIKENKTQNKQTDKIGENLKSVFQKDNKLPIIKRKKSAFIEKI